MEIVDITFCSVSFKHLFTSIIVLSLSQIALVFDDVGVQVFTTGDPLSRDL